MVAASLPTALPKKRPAECRRAKASKRQSSNAARGEAQRRSQFATSLSTKEPFATPTTRQVFWLPDRSTGCTFPRKEAQWAAARSGYGSVRSRLQRRDRNGLAPFSLFFSRDDKPRETPSVEGGQSSTVVRNVNEPASMAGGKILCDQADWRQ